MKRVLVLLVVILPLAGRAQATVYSWRDGDGAYHFTNQAADVPPGQLEGFRAVSEAQPVASPADGAAADPPATRADDPPSDYEQGLAAGLRMAEEQIRLAGELARERAESAPVEAPAQVVYLAPPPPVVVDVIQSGDAGCGPYGGYCGGYGYGYPFNSWIVGPAFFPRSFSRHGRFLRGGHRFGNHSMFTGGFAGGFGGRRGLHGGHFGGRR